MDELESLNHSRWECKYHVVFIPKCRRKTLYVQLRPVSWGSVPQAGGAKREADRGRAFDARPCPHDDLDPAAICRVAGGRLHQGESAPSTWRALTVNTGGTSSGRAFGHAGIIDGRPRRKADRSRAMTGWKGRAAVTGGWHIIANGCEKSALCLGVSVVNLRQAKRLPIDPMGHERPRCPAEGHGKPGGFYPGGISSPPQNL